MVVAAAEVVVAGGDLEEAGVDLEVVQAAVARVAA